MYIHIVRNYSRGKNIMKNKYLSIFETDEDGDFKNDRIVLVVFGLAILGAGLTEGML